MRGNWVVPLAGVLVLAWAGALRADDQKEARAIVDKGIKAAGGQEKLAKFKSMTWKEKGTYYGMGDALPYAGNYAIQWPDQFRMEIVGVFTMVLNGDKGWTRTGNETKEMSKEQLAEQQENHYGGWVASLLPLTKDNEFKLSLLGEEKVDNRPAVGVRVSSKGHRDVNLFFDKDSGLLVKSAQRVKAEEQGGKEVNQETWYQDHKEVSGVKVPGKVIMKRDGKQFVEAENDDIKLVEKLDNSVFDKP